MEDYGVWMMRRAVDTIAVTYQSETDSTSNSNATRALINSLIFAESKSVRTSTIILAAFNVCAALTTAFSILYDCYWASKRCSPIGRAEKFCVSKIHPAETFPLVLALGIAIQGTIIAVTQSFGLQSIYVMGCGTIGQIVFPAVFLVPYIQLVFGLECALRSFRTLPFPARGKYDVTICLATITLMLIGTWVPTNVNRENDQCFASLLWFVTKFGLPGLVILSTVGILCIISAIIIFRKCTTTSLINENERIAASRMVFYLILAVVPLTFIIPWFVTLTLGKPTLTTSMMATVVLNLSGLTNGALHIFLRSNTAMTAFTPKDLSEWSKRKHEIRIWGPNELGFDGHILQPVTGPRSESQNSLVRKEKGHSIDSITTLRYQYVKPPQQMEQSSAPTKQEQMKQSLITTSPSRRHQRKQSYSIFPTEAVVTSLKGTQLPATTFSPISGNITLPEIKVPKSIFTITAANQEHGDGLESIYIATDFPPPPEIHLPGLAPRHARNSSMVSSATVQIGLRISNANANPLPQILSATHKGPSPSNPANNAGLTRPETSTLQIQTQNLHIPYLPMRSSLAPSPLKTSSNLNKSVDTAAVSRSGSIDRAERDQRMKTLPPVPRMLSSISQMSNQSGEIIQVQLSPTVYSPSSSPKSAKSSSGSNGSYPTKLGLPSRPGPSSPRNALVSSPIQPLKLSTSKSQGKMGLRESKADWI